MKEVVHAQACLARCVREDRHRPRYQSDGHVLDIRLQLLAVVSILQLTFYEHVQLPCLQVLAAALKCWSRHGHSAATSGLGKPGNSISHLSMAQKDPGRSIPAGLCCLEAQKLYLVSLALMPPTHVSHHVYIMCVASCSLCGRSCTISQRAKL